MELTNEEKRLFLEKTRELIHTDVLSKEDITDIYRIYYRAATRELKRLQEGG